MSGIVEVFQRPDVGGEHGPHRERRFRVVGIDDGLRHRSLHRLGEFAEVGLEQVLDQDPVFRHPPLAQDARAIGEQLAGRGDPERIDGVLLLRDQRRGHGVEIPRACRFVERRPARAACVKRVEQHVAVRIEERAGVAAHLVVEHAALAALSDLRDEIGDQHGLSGPRGARDDGVLGLGTLGIRHPRDPVGRRLRERQNPIHRAPAKRPYAPFQLLDRGEFRAADAPFATELPPPDPEQHKQRGNGAGRELRAERRAREQLALQFLAHGERTWRGGDVGQRKRHHLSVRPADILPRRGIVAQAELGLRRGYYHGGVPLVTRGAVPEPPGGAREDPDRGQQQRGAQKLAPHVQAVEDGLPAPQRAAAEGPHKGEFSAGQGAVWRIVPARRRRTIPRLGAEPESLAAARQSRKRAGVEARGPEGETPASRPLPFPVPWSFR